MTQAGGGGSDQRAGGVSDDKGVDSRLILKEQSQNLRLNGKWGGRKGTVS